MKMVNSLQNYISLVAGKIGTLKKSKNKNWNKKDYIKSVYKNLVRVFIEFIRRKKQWKKQNKKENI